MKIKHFTCYRIYSPIRGGETARTGPRHDDASDTFERVGGSTGFFNVQQSQQTPTVLKVGHQGTTTWISVKPTEEACARSLVDLAGRQFYLHNGRVAALKSTDFECRHGHEFAGAAVDALTEVLGILAQKSVADGGILQKSTLKALGSIYRFPRWSQEAKRRLVAFTIQILLCQKLHRVRPDLMNVKFRDRHGARLRVFCSEFAAKMLQAAWLLGRTQNPNSSLARGIAEAAAKIPYRVAGDYEKPVYDWADRLVREHGREFRDMPWALRVNPGAVTPSELCTYLKRGLESEPGFVTKVEASVYVAFNRLLSCLYPLANVSPILVPCLLVFA